MRNYFEFLMEQLLACSKNYNQTKEPVVEEIEEKQVKLEFRKILDKLVINIILPNGYIKGTTGAGDAFCAGVLLGIYNDLSDKEILDYGRTAAVMALREADATSGLVTMEEAKEIVKGFERR